MLTLILYLCFLSRKQIPFFSLKDFLVIYTYSIFSAGRRRIPDFLSNSGAPEKTTLDPRASFIKSLYVTEYTVCQAFCPVVQIGSSHHLTRKGVLLPLLVPHSFAGGGGMAAWWDPIPTRGQKLKY
jgi:hypothetical protein